MSNNGECKHLNFVVRGQEIIGLGFCPDCEKPVHLSECFNNLAVEMRRVLAKVREKEEG